MTATAAYSACIQEAMWYNKLRSSDCLLVMSIMRAVMQGFTKKQWKTEQLDGQTATGRGTLG